MKLIFNLFIFVLIHCLFNESTAKIGDKTILPMSVDISSPTLHLNQAFDVINYSADIDLRKAPSTEMTGISRIKVFWKDNPEVNLFYFHLRSLIVDSVFYNGFKVSTSAIETPVSPIFHYSMEPPPGSPQDTAVISVYYHGNMTAANGDSFGGVFSQDSILYSIGVGLRNNYVSATEHWLACYDHPSDKATLDFRFITDNGFVVASNGLLKLEKTTIDSKDYDVYHWKSDIQTATYLMTFACGKFKAVNFTGFYYPIVVYCRPGDTNAVKYTFQKVPEMVTAFQNRFGKYLFEKVGYVLTPMTGGAMEHQTMITMPELEIRKLFKSKDTVNITAAHELSHGWFGNSVTPYDFRDAWLNEGFAKFAETTWLEEVNGYNSYLTGITKAINNYIMTDMSNEGTFPLYDFPHNAPSSNYPFTIYDKGCVVTAMLRYYLGDDEFYSAMMNYLDYYAFRNSTTDSLEKYLEEFTGQNLSWFFDQWVYKKGFPIIDVQIYKSQSQVNGLFKAEIKITQVQPGDYGVYTNLPVEITFNPVNGAAKSVIYNMTNKEQTFYSDSLPDFISVLVNKGPTVRTLIKLKNLTTSLHEKEDTAEEINFYPNPVTNIINLLIKGISHNLNYSIVNLDGTELLKGTIEADDSGTITKKFIVEDFAVGNYYLKLEGNNFFRILNFIKL
jgi:aminopeptidase N